MRAFHGEMIDVSARMGLLFRKVADEEYRALERNYKFVSELLSCPVGGVELLCHALMEEMVDLRLDTLVFIASASDHSSRIRKIIPRLFHTDKHMRARAFEVMDNTGDLKINRTIMRLIEQKEHPVAVRNSTFSKDEVFRILEKLFKSENEWVKWCAVYSASCIHEFTGEQRWAELKGNSC